MEEKITQIIVQSYFEKLQNSLCVDVAIVGAGPSGLVAARELALKGKNVAIFERKLAPGGGIWGGGMLFNEVVIQKDAVHILDDFNIKYLDKGEGYYSADAVEMSAGLILGAVQAGAKLYNSVSVEDIVFKDGKVKGVVILWTTVAHMGLHVDPLVVIADAVIDGTGHPSEIITLASDKAGIKLDTPTGKVMGEKPMWVESGEQTTVENTKELYPGLYASGMAANNVSGGFRMGPIFGGMLKSGQKVAQLILDDLK